MPTKPRFSPPNNDSDPSLNTWVFEIGDVRYQLEPQVKKKPVRTLAFPRIKPYAWETPEGLKQQDFKTFIKFITLHQKPKQPARPSTTKKKFNPSRIPRPTAPIHPGWSNTEGGNGFGCEWLIYRRPEGYGKSSLVRSLIAKGGHVVFCSKSNKQLIEHERNFKERWPDLKIHRHISKAQHLSEVVEALTGQEFKLTTTPSISPYAQEQVDEPRSLERLIELVGDVGSVIFKAEYEEWKAPDIDGKQFDIILITLTAFQVLCTGFRKAWWEHLNLSEMKPVPTTIGPRSLVIISEIQKRMIRERGNRIDGEWIPDKKGKQSIEYPDPTDDGMRSHCLPKVVVVVDDPDRTDFDWMRRIDGEEEAAELYSLTNTKGTKHTHILAKRWEDYFEQRQERATFGFGIKRGTKSSRPMAIVFTTELVTAKFACRTFENLKTQFDERKKVRNQFQAALKEAMEQYTVKQKYNYVFSDYSPVSNETHCTLIFTDLVRKRNHAMLIPIIQELKDKFPEQNLSFIANGLGSEWNLMNVKGINTLNQGASVIKISALHPHTSLNLMVHFTDEQPRDIILQLVADQANQAIGRNQGNRFSNFPTIVLCEPKYRGIEKLLRYKLTPWSSEHSQKPSMLQYAVEETPMEKWLKYRLHKTRWFATSNVAEEYVKDAPIIQQEIYWKWRHSLL